MGWNYPLWVSPHFLCIYMGLSGNQDILRPSTYAKNPALSDQPILLVCLILLTFTITSPHSSKSSFLLGLSIGPDLGYRSVRERGERPGKRIGERLTRRMWDRFQKRDGMGVVMEGRSNVGLSCLFTIKEHEGILIRNMENNTSVCARTNAEKKETHLIARQKNLVSGSGDPKSSGVSFTNRKIALLFEVVAWSMG